MWKRGQGDPDNLSVALVFAVGGVLVVAAVFALQAFYNYASGRLLEQRVVQVEDTALMQARAEQAEKLTGYRWIDRKAGVVAIPIERAMELVAQEQAGRGLEE